MTSVVNRYFATLTARLEHVRTTESGSIERAAEACARSIAVGKLVFTFGTGHGAFPALETFPRTGTIVDFRPIVESTMISLCRPRRLLSKSLNWLTKYGRRGCEADW